VFVHALSGAASFAACLRLFRSYPLAVSPWSADGTNRSIVLRYPGADEDRASGKSGFFVLSQDTAEHFVLRPWAGGQPGDKTACLPRARQHVHPGRGVKTERYVALGDVEPARGEALRDRSDPGVRRCVVGSEDDDPHNPRTIASDTDLIRPFGSANSTSPRCWS